MCSPSFPKSFSATGSIINTGHDGVPRIIDRRIDLIGSAITFPGNFNWFHSDLNQNGDVQNRFTGKKESLNCGIPAWDLYLSGMFKTPSFYTGILIPLN